MFVLLEALWKENRFSTLILPGNSNKTLKPIVKTQPITFQTFSMERNILPVEQYRSEIRLHLLCSLIRIHTASQVSP